MRRRLGWESLKGRSLPDFGCGVRFARTIHNLGLPLNRYIGVDVHAEAIAWRKLTSRMNASNSLMWMHEMPIAIVRARLIQMHCFDSIYPNAKQRACSR
jgi:hypothetical protein